MTEKEQRLNKIIIEAQRRHEYLARNNRDDQPVETTMAILRLITELAVEVRNAP